MPKFKIGDHVERIGVLASGQMRNGVVVRVIPNKIGQDLFYEYEVTFGTRMIAVLYETQLRLASDSN